MRILFVAFSDSIHTARWIGQLADQDWDIHLFPSRDMDSVHPDLRDITVHHSLYGTRRSMRPPAIGRPGKSVKQTGVPILLPKYSWYAGHVFRTGLQITQFRDYRVWQLRRVIKRLQPDIVHSMEFQAGAYLVLDAKRGYKGQFPPWIATNWGSDVYLYGRLAAHAQKVRDVLASCDYYSCENQRDIGLARQMGFQGQVLPVLPNTGGFDMAQIARLRDPAPASSRRVILVKGYQHFAGRALVALRAIALAADALKGYRVAVYLAADDVKIAAELVSRETGIPIEIVPYVSHEEMLRWYGKARIYIGLSISDAIPTSLLEAMVMGTFPIQSNTGGAEEWVTDGESGLIVPPEDPEHVAAAIRRAVSDDALVDRAEEINARVARERLDKDIIRPQVIKMYEKIYEETRGQR